MNSRVEILDEGFGTTKLKGCSCDRKSPVSNVISSLLSVITFPASVFAAYKCAKLQGKIIIGQTDGKLKEKKNS